MSTGINKNDKVRRNVIEGRRKQSGDEYCSDSNSKLRFRGMNRAVYSDSGADIIQGARVQVTMAS